jgi:hypothetical protein
MHFSKNLQYAVSGVLAVYIVFFTRPAPQVVVKALASPIAQLVALAGIVWVGASVSLLVALVAAVALVLSIPAREYLDVDVDEAKKDVKDVLKAAGAGAKTAAAKEAAKKLKKIADKGSSKDKDTPAPAGHTLADSKTSDDGKAHFTLMNAAPF